MAKIIVCKRCGREKNHHAKGLCHTCYYKPYKRILITCIMCNQKKRHHAKQLCDSCYKKKNGIKKKYVSKRKYIWSFKYPKCVECGTVKIKHQGKGLCRNCYEKQLKRPIIICKKCLKEKRHNGKGLCKNCYQSLWKKNNRDKMNKYRKIETEKNPKIKISRNISRGIQKSKKEKKNNRRWEDLVGYTLQDLMQHLEKQFKPKMGWENYGKGWHIGHRKPQSWFKFESYEDKEFKECWTLDNLFPQWKEDNMNQKDYYALPTLNQFINSHSSPVQGL